ncbi:FUSC family protein [Pseudomonas aeruginosa]
MCASLTRLFDGRAMGRALAVSLPLFVLYSASGDANWLLANIATISVAVVVERVGSAPLAALGQGVAIILGFLGLSFALAWGAAFAIACAALAAAAVALSGLDTRLRTLGNFVFIPVLYLACEVAATHRAALSLVPYLVVATLPSVALAGVDTLRHAALARRYGTLLRWRGAHLTGHAAAHDKLLQAVLAVTLAVACSATLVAWRHIEYGQWAIWSSASVVTGNAASAHLKLRDRGLGALLGVPLGLVVGAALPHVLLVHTLATLASVLTLVGFRHYATGFAARCACIACASWAIQQSPLVASLRVAEVLAGGAIGVASVWLVRFLARN